MAQAQGPWGELLAERALELSSEATLAEQIGRPPFRALARVLYAQGDSASDLEADELASAWCRLADECEAESPVASDDPLNPTSLLIQLRAEMTRCNVSVPIRVDRRLAAVATVDRDCVWIRGGETLTPSQARRVAVHEIHGHAVRRVRSRDPVNAVSLSGFKRSDEHEEGRAVWLEACAELLNSARRRELAWRHWAARACQRGADFVETVNVLLDMECSLQPALAIALRVWRGGGLARESIYLRAYIQVRDVLNDSPAVEQWMQQGRYSMDVAVRLASGQLALPRIDLSCA
jgi:hypothetical protein